MSRLWMIILTHLIICAVNAQNLPVGIVSIQDTTKSVQVGIISSVAVEKGSGLQLSGVSNVSASPFKGIQLSVVNNIAKGLPRGLQVASLLNVSSAYMRGMQLGGVNYADSLNGTQLGLINIARTHPKGWQVGILNITRDTIAHKIGLVNVNPLTKIDYMFSAGTSSKINVAVRFRNHSTYNILGIGTHYMGLDKKFSGAVFYRLGQYFQITPKLSLSGDLGYYHIETFEQNSSDTPERLFSIQARINADYQLTKNLGVFASAGWGTTRYYHNLTKYRSRPLVELGITLRQGKNHQQSVPLPTNVYEQLTDSVMALPPKQHPWIAAAEVFGINLGVHLFDRLVMNEDFAHTTFKSIRHNFETGVVWDNDVFSTNMFAHPYHGNLYYNAARSNGLTFWQSAPYALGGSLMWEFFGETEPPAINDIIATSMGGIAMGEITHRLSQIVLNDRSRGTRRFLREAAATLINPIQGLHRIVSGRAWQVRNTHYKYHDYDALPIDFSLSVGNRYLADEGALFRGEHNPFVNMYLCYGTSVDGERHNTPYDFFDVDFTFGLSKNQPIVNAISILGRLWSTPILDRKQMVGEFGIYQHFNYYDSKPVKDGSDLTPYRISEAAAIGPGFIFSLPPIGILSRTEQRIFLNAILLGGTKSDYFNVIDRDYNMGSGFSIKSKTHVDFSHVGRFILHLKYFRLFTWKGYETKDFTGYMDGTSDLHYLNVQGDKSNASLLVLNPIIEFDLNRQWSINFSGSFFARSTRYKYYDDVKTNTFEVKTGLTCHF